MDIKEGDRLEIKGRRFEIVKIMGEADYNSEKDILREFLSLELHELGDKGLLPKSFIQRYEDNGQIVFIDNGKKEEIKESDIGVMVVNKKD